MLQTRNDKNPRAKKRLFGGRKRKSITYWRKFYHKYFETSELLKEFRF